MYQALAKYSEIPPFVEVGYEPQTTFWGDFGVADVVSNGTQLEELGTRKQEP